jgi:hypothetical protein
VGEIVRAHTGIIVNVNEREAVLCKQRSIAGHSIVVKRHAVHRAGDTAIVGAIDFGACEKKRRARFQNARTLANTAD